MVRPRIYRNHIILQDRPGTFGLVVYDRAENAIFRGHTLVECREFIDWRLALVN